MPSETGEGDWRFDFVDAVCFESLFPKKHDHTFAPRLRAWPDQAFMIAKPAKSAGRMQKG
jgi:hypothetical protein